MSISIKYVPLSFINTDDEVLKQIKNSVLFSYLLSKHEETTLEHYLESTQYGYTASAQKSGSHRLVRITDIRNGGVDWENVPYCDCDREDNYLLKQNDILIARTGGTTGKSFIVNKVPNNSVYASYLIRLRLKNGVNIDFINAFLNSYVFWSQIVEMKSGSAMPNVNAEKLKTLRLPKCDSDIQKELSKAALGESMSSEYVGVFDKVKSIEGLYNSHIGVTTELTHQLDLIKQLRQAFLREAMQGKLVQQDTNDESASQLLEKIIEEKERLIKEKKISKDKPLPPIKLDEIPFEIPENWTWCRLGAITTYGTCPKAEPEDIRENTWVLDLEDIEKDTSMLLGKLRFKERKSLSTKSVFKKGEVLYSKLRPYLDKVIVADEDGVCTTEILPLKCLAGMNPYFFRYLLKRTDFLNYVNSVTKGMKMPRLGTKEGVLALMPLAPINEQQRIVAKLDELMKFCDELEESIKGSQQQNEMLLQQVLREALEPNKL
ncbi:MAG TPA: restriction endonuclease subunit S [Williamwhitmania sp.]|nr:restriction endonuclease subunit S [Williamwhitmania sp.]